ncbi:MAG: RNA polymerase sigma-70 factor [Dysgonamonadaceae bacterium]|jgi:RNA polymerase sigma-70 factor (ECF subfamily)|nr:RNA polymerase sigma-70 factor [Dysgonamonadaceae bacterium]
MGKPITDSELLSQEFESFFQLNFPKAKAFALKILKSEEDAEDIAQDVFVKLWEHPEIWHEKEHIDGYVFMMIKNHILNFLKRKKYRQNYQETLPSPETLKTDFDIHEQMYAKELALLAKVVINQMPERRKECYLLSHIQEKSNAEIASMLGLSVRTVERHLYLALSELKKIIYLLFFFNLIE